MTAEKSEDLKRQELVLSEAKKRFQLCVDAEKDYRKAALEDQRFLAGEQWPDNVKRSRELDFRPCLTINKLPQFVRQVTNDQRQNRPSIKVNPVDDKADIETAKVLQGIIRHIEYNSNADIAYDTAFEGCAGIGRGYFRIITDYCDPESFEQEIFIKRLRNHFMAYLDPYHQEPDGSDSDYGFIYEDMSIDDFKKSFPKAQYSTSEQWRSIGDTPPMWLSQDTIRVCEYYYKVYKTKTICLVQLEDGSQQSVEKSELPEELPQGLQIIQERETVVPEIKWAKLNYFEILEETSWPGKWIPIVPVVGDEMDIDGKKILSGIVRHAKDPQRMYNYWASNETETIALAPRAPFIGAEGQFEGFENEWKTANVRNHAYLQYKLKTVGGVIAPAPQRQVFEPPIQAMAQARMQSSDDLKATTGIYDASLGNRSNENSGVAIQRRNAQAQTNNFHYIDNLSRSIRHAGRILVDLIPHIYDFAKMARLLGEDGKPEMVMINQPYQKNGQEVAHYLNVGKYDVTVQTGPSFATKRQEAAETMLEFTKTMPQSAPYISDLIARNMDWPGSDVIADRLKKLLPPGIAEENDKEKEQPIPPQVQQQIQQAQMMIDQLTQELNAKSQIIETKTVELESRERIEMEKLRVQLEIEMLKAGSNESINLLKAEIGAITQRLSLLSMNEPIENETNEQPAQGQNNQPTGGQSPGQPMGV